MVTNLVSSAMALTLADAAPKSSRAAEIARVILKPATAMVPIAVTRPNTSAMVH
jgi:hypothetical protein